MKHVHFDLGYDDHTTQVTIIRNGKHKQYYNPTESSIARLENLMKKHGVVTYSEVSKHKIGVQYIYMPSTDKNKTALGIVNPGASNPVGVAWELSNRLRTDKRGYDVIRNDPAYQLMTYQLASLFSVGYMPLERYVWAERVCKGESYTKGQTVHLKMAYRAVLLANYENLSKKKQEEGQEIISREEYVNNLDSEWEISEAWESGQLSLKRGNYTLLVNEKDVY